MRTRVGAGRSVHYGVPSVYLVRFWTAEKIMKWITNRPGNTEVVTKMELNSQYIKMRR